MAKRVAYECNLCRTLIGPTGKSEGGRTAGVGIYFCSGNTLELREVSKTEHHVCAGCLLSLKQARVVYTGVADAWDTDWRLYLGLPPEPTNGELVSEHNAVTDGEEPEF